MRSFITGVDGFIGTWLAEALHAAGDQVFGLARSRAARIADDDLRDGRDDGRNDGVVRHPGNITSLAAVMDAIEAARPDRVFHLAALNNIADSFAQPALTMETNVVGSVNLLQALRELAPAACLVSVGSSAEYGKTAAQAAPLTEDLPLLPTGPYGVSKASQGQLCRVYAEVHGLRAIHVRPFAIIGPRKTRDALSDFCQNVVAIERGETERFAVGPLTSERDFVDVRDAIAALILISEKGAAGSTYNLCNGGVATLESVVAILRGLSRRPLQPVPDPARSRPADDRRIVGDNTRLRSLGYVPRFPLAETVAATLDYWRARAAERP
jgi:GDP-4-dehydro-6-deoxy-D-mannose reductase